MTVEQQIEAYLASQPETKQTDMRTLHDRILAIMPGCHLWFLDGRNEAGKIVSNPNIGYGALTMDYADGSSREFYQIGLSGNTGGISLYIMGLDDKSFLARTYGDRLGKANVTGYCIKFKRLADIDMAVLEEAIRHGALSR